MEFQWKIDDRQSGMTVKEVARSKNLSSNIIKHLKLCDQGGFFVNDERIKIWKEVEKGDCLQVIFPDEAAHPYIQPVDLPIDILYEDDHFLLVDKPAELLSNPSFNQPAESIANRVLNYYLQKGCRHLTLHLVTRLDRNTSGVLFFAKHKWAHSLMDQVLRKQEMKKIYLAMTPPSEGILDDHGLLDFPIARSEESIIERIVADHGKASLTEYWRVESGERGDLFKINLHTGRTHQIRVHFNHVGLPLLGDTLYGGDDTVGIMRQALHCQSLSFDHPFTSEKMHIEAELPDDFQQLLNI